MARWIREAYGFENMEVIPNASDNDLVDTLENDWELPDWARGKQLALYTGTLGLIDDCSQILDVAQITQAQNINDLEYVLIGDGKERLELENKMRSLNLRHVHFLGSMPKKELIEREQCGINVPVNDPAAMADAVVRLAHGNGLRAKLGANAKRVAIEQFDRSALAQKLRLVLLKVARHTGAEECRVDRNNALG
jgi:glycosyltransferase involved in cell wall biosynthesis